MKQDLLYHESWVCKCGFNESLLTCEASNLWRKLLSYSHCSIGNYMLAVISCHF